MSGHIRRSGARSFELKFDLGTDPLTGRRKIRYVSFKGTRRTAELELAKLIAQHATGTSIDPNKTSVAEFLARWDSWAASNLSGKTLERHRVAIRLHIVPHIGGMQIQRVRPIHLVELYRELQESGAQDGGALSPASVAYVHRLLHRALGHAMAWGIVSQNVATAVSPPPASNAEISILTEAQIAAVLNHLNGRTLKPIVAFLLGTGARRGEVLALRWRDINWDTNTVRVERAIEQTKAGLKIKGPKTRAGKRSIAISPWLVAELRAHRTRQQERRLSLGMGRAAGDDLVFARWDGGMRAPHGISQKFAQAMRALKIDVKLHALRHTHVSQLIAAGVDLLTISRRIGHASPSITLNVYGHLGSNTDTHAAEVTQTMFAKIEKRNAASGPGGLGAF
jgi:integrase